MPPAANNNMPSHLGRYEILRPLARGGMAELFLARSTGIEGFEKLVVVKRILPELQGDGELLHMFLDEARLAAGLHHSNIAQVYDIGEDAGVPFFSMEYLQGEDLRAVAREAWQRDGRVPLEHALSIAIGVCAGLHYAHEKRGSDGNPLGIVHRDISPPNVIVTFEGGVKVVDFGVAKARRRLTETRHGTLKGKITYMSPEQCLGDEVDRRSDVFAISILLWELVTGRRLYGGKSDFSIMKSITERDAPLPSLVWPDCPPELDRIVARGLRRHREGRWQTAEELQLALEDFARERRLALSPVGLSRLMKELFGGEVQALAQAEREGSEALLSLVASKISARADAPDDEGGTRATMFDGELQVTPAPARQHTRAVARRPRRGRLLVAAGGVALVTAMAAGGLALRLRRLDVELLAPPAPRKAQPIAVSPQFTPLSPGGAAGGAARPGGAASTPGSAAPAPGSAAPAPGSPAVDVANGVPISGGPPPSAHPIIGTTARNVASPVPPSQRSSTATGKRRTRAHPHTRKAPSTPAAVDLDAPLPPR